MKYTFPKEFHPNLFKHKKIGLLGGSFNPGHQGHLELALKARQFFDFDEIWWVINPQNPLKPAHITRPFEERFEYCKSLTKPYPFIKPCPIEQFNQTNMTYQLVEFLKIYYPTTHFVWLMGSDLVCNIHKWEHYETLVKHFSLIIYYRQTHFYQIKQSPLLNQLKDNYLPLEKSKNKLFQPSPKWTVFPYFHNLISSTEIRKNML